MPSQPSQSNTDLVRWVAEELLGWTPSMDRLAWLGPDRIYGQADLESWHGIGLVFHAMKRQPAEVQQRFNRQLLGMVAWWEDDEPWDEVFAAARRAVEGEG